MDELERLKRWLWNVCTCQGFRPSDEDEDQREPLLPGSDADPVEGQPAGLTMPRHPMMPDPGFPDRDGGLRPPIRGYDVSGTDEEPGPKPQPTSQPLQPDEDRGPTSTGQADELPGTSGIAPTTPPSGGRNPDGAGRIATEDSTTEGWVDAAAAQARPVSRGTFTPERPSMLNEAGRREAAAGGTPPHPGPPRRLEPPLIERLQRRQGAQALREYLASPLSPEVSLRARERRYRKREADLQAAEEKLQRREKRLRPQEDALRQWEVAFRQHEADVLAEINGRQRAAGEPELEAGPPTVEMLPVRPPRPLLPGGAPASWNGPDAPGEEVWGTDHRAWQANLDAWSRNLRVREADFKLRKADHDAWKLQVEFAEGAARRWDDQQEMEEFADLEELDDDFDEPRAES